MGRMEDPGGVRYAAEVRSRRSRDNPNARGSHVAASSPRRPARWLPDCRFALSAQARSRTAARPGEGRSGDALFASVVGLRPLSARTDSYCAPRRSAARRSSKQLRPWRRRRSGLSWGCATLCGRSAGVSQRPSRSRRRDRVWRDRSFDRAYSSGPRMGRDDLCVERSAEHHLLTLRARSGRPPSSSPRKTRPTSSLETFRRAAAIANRAFQLMAGPTYGVLWIDNYDLKRSPSDRGEARLCHVGRHREPLRRHRN